MSRYGTARLRYSAATRQQRTTTRRVMCAAGASVAIQTLYHDRGACDTERGIERDTL